MRIDDDMAKRIELAGLKGSGIEKLALNAAIVRNPDWQKRLLHILEIREGFAENPHPFLSPDDEELVPGEIPLGTIVRMDGNLGPQVYLPIEILRRYPHILVTGASGTGKSTTVRYLIMNFTQNSIGSLQLDSEDEYVNLLAYFPEGNCWVFDDSTFKRNPLQPLPGEERRRTYGRIKRVFREAFLRDGSIGLLGEELIDISPSEAVDLLNGQEPTLRQLLDRLGRARYRLDSRRGQYLESLKNRLGNVVEFVDMYDCIEGIDISDWLTNKCIILSLVALSDELKDFVVNELLASIQDWTHQNPSPGIRFVITVDEAHRFFSPKKAERYDLGDPIILDAARTFRKRGVNLILSTQVFHDLPVTALANISTFLVFRTSEGSCIRAVGQALSLTREQMEYLPKLGDRRAILKHPLIPEPFVVEFPELDFDQYISKHEIQERMAPVFEGLRWVPRPREETKAISGGGAIASAQEKKRRNQSQEPRRAPLTKEALGLHGCDSQAAFFAGYRARQHDWSFRI